MWQLQECLDVRAHFGRRQRATRLSDVEREQLKGDELRSKGLGRGDTDLRAGMCVDGAIGFPRRHTADDIADREARHTLSFGFAKGRERVRGLTRLCDDNGEFILRDDGIPVAILRAIVDR